MLYVVYFSPDVPMPPGGNIDSSHHLPSLDSVQINNNSISTDNGYNNTPTKTDNSNLRIILAAGATALIFLVIIVIILVLVWRWKTKVKRRKRTPSGQVISWIQKQDRVHLLDNLNVVGKNPLYVGSDKISAQLNGIQTMYIPRSSVKLMSVIGEGAFGKVFKGKSLCQPFL